MIDKPQIRVACLGECMVELITTRPGEYRQTFGGDTLNTAAYVSRLAHDQGVTVQYITALGTDDFSDSMLAFFERHKVGTAHVRRINGPRPGLYIIEVDARGERSFHYWRGEAAAKHLLDDISASDLVKTLSQFDCVYLSGISLAILTKKGRNTLYKTLEELASTGTPVIFDSNYRPGLWPSPENARKAVQRLLRHTDIAILTNGDMRTLFNLKDDEAIFTVCDKLGVPEVVIKRGEDSCLISAGGERHEVPSLRGIKVVDTTAAGDSFSAAYLTARMLGHDPLTCAGCGHALASEVIQHHGAVIETEHIPRNLIPPLLRSQSETMHV